MNRVPKLSNQQIWNLEDFGDMIWDVSVCESVRQRRSMILVFGQLELVLFDVAYQAYHPEARLFDLPRKIGKQQTYANEIGT